MSFNSRDFENSAKKFGNLTADLTNLDNNHMENSDNEEPNVLLSGNIFT